MTNKMVKGLVGFGIATLISIVSLTPASAKSTSKADAKEATKAAIKYKQCIVLFSPQYKKTRIRPIKFEFRWCDKSKKNDCSSWDKDKIVDQGRAFSVSGHCFTYAKMLHMELRYNTSLNKERMSKVITLKPQAIALKGNLEPHPFCATKASHSFKIRRGSLVLKSGRPHNVKKLACVWNPIK